MEQTFLFNDNTLIIFDFYRQYRLKIFSAFSALIFYCITIYEIHALYACILASYA